MKMSRSLIVLAAAAVFATFASNASAQLTPYSQDFESLVQTDPIALTLDGWKVFANVFDAAGTGFLYNYGVFGAPNGGPAFSGVTDFGTGGFPPVGAQGLVTYSDYNNADQNIGNRIETNVFQEQTIGAGDIGKTALFSFVAAPGNLAGASEALAFIKTLDPNNGYNTSNFVTVATDALPAGNSSLSLSLDLTTPALVGQIFQFGFLTEAANYEASGVNYDNVNLSVVPEPTSLCLAGMGLMAMFGARRQRA
jgi:hypothetical protein